MQTTLARPTQCDGIGVHSGEPATASLQPAPADTGILFIREDLEGEPLERREFHARHKNASGEYLRTELTNAHGNRIATIEHVMAALYGLGIDNARILVNGPELPIMDGSAKAFVQACLKAGVETLTSPRKALRILAPVSAEHEGSRAELSPSEAFRLDITIDFQDSAIGRQHYAATLSPQIFVEEIAPARTFGFAQSLKDLHKAGLALGASLENTIAVREGAILNEEPLRFPDECVRHKALDAIGDMALIGCPIKGTLRAFKSGHALHSRLLSALFANPESWRIETEET